VPIRLQVWANGENVLSHDSSAKDCEVLVQLPVCTLGAPLGWFALYGEGVIDADPAVIPGDDCQEIDAPIAQITRISCLSRYAIARTA